MTKLVLSDGSVRWVPKEYMERLPIFEKCHELLVQGEYRVKSDVSEKVVDVFLARLFGDMSPTLVTDGNIRALKGLCHELGYNGFDTDFTCHGDSSVEVQRIINGRIDDHEARLCELERKVAALVRHFGSLDHTKTARFISEQFEQVCRKFESHIGDVTVEIWRSIESLAPKSELDRAVADIENLKGNERKLVEDIARVDKQCSSVRQIQRQIEGFARKNELQFFGSEIESLKENERRLAEDIARLSKQCSSAPQSQMFSYQCPVRPFLPFCGIISHLRDVCHGNPHTAGEIEITASSTGRCGSAKCWNLVDYGWHSSWYTLDEANAYVQVDFKKRKVRVTGYSLKYGKLGNCGYPRHWVLQARNDESPWTTIDQRQNNDDLDGDYKVATYTCNSPSDQFYQYVRLCQTDPNNKNKNYLLLSEIEFFGQLT